MNDPFAWLEDATSTETTAWYEEQNRLTDLCFRDSKKSQFIDELLQISDSDRRGIPRKHGAYTFWTEQKASWSKPKLMCAHKKLKDEHAVVLDFDDSDLSLDGWFASPSGKKLIYLTSELGNEQTTLRVRDMLTGKDTADVIPFAGFTDQGDICWLDDQRFIYPRMNGFSKTGPEDKWLLGTKLYIHKLGTVPKSDELVFGKELVETVMLTPTLSSDKQHVYVTACFDELTHELYLVDLKTMQSVRIEMQTPASCTVKTGFEKVYVLTNYQADRYRLLACPEDDLELNLDDWDEVLPESDDVLTDVWLHSSKKIIAHYLHNVSSELRAYDEYGNQTSRINIPKNTIVHGMRCEPTSARFYIYVSGFTTPPTIYTAEACDVKLDVFWSGQQLEGDNDVEVTQEWAKSSDGVEVPYFVLRLKQNTKPAPTILYGYGGFNISLEPSYLTSMRTWVMGGGTYVLMNLRGGSEFGEAWHKAGSMEHKQNTFSDCHAIAKDVVSKGYSTHDQLGVLGGSNGGLLVATVIAQQPELYRAGAALVPLTDMFEFYKHQVAEFWVHEYGDPRIPEQRAWIEKWNPYGLVTSLESRVASSGFVQFPALYVECGLHDARVHPFHSFKYVKAVQENYKDKTKGAVVLRTWTDSGHSGGNLSRKDRAAQTAEYLAFFARELKLAN